MCLCVCFFCGRKIESFFVTRSHTTRLKHCDMSALRRTIRGRIKSLLLVVLFFLLSSSCCHVLVFFFFFFFWWWRDRMWLKRVLWFMSLFFSLSRSSFSLVSLWRENVQIYVLSVRTRRRRFGAHLFLLSRYRSNASIDFTERFLLMLSFSDEQTINRCRRTSSGAKRNFNTKNTERGGDHLHDFFFPGERESGRV